MKKVSMFLLLGSLVLLFGTAQAQIKIDGLFFDWPAKAQLDVPPNQEEKTFAEGDDTDPARGSSDPNYFADMDIEDVYAMDDADYVYIRVKMNSIANVMNIMTDTSYHGGGAIALYISVDPGAHDTTGLTWGWWGSGYDYLVQVFPEDSAFKVKAGQQPLWEHSQSGFGWDFVPYDTVRGVHYAWNASNNDVEVAIPKSMLLNPHHMANFTRPDSIAIMAYAGENNDPWRADYASNASVAGFMLQLKKPGPITIDGLFFDWPSTAQVDVAPNAEEKTFAEGDDTDPPRGSTDPAYFADMDLSHVYATDDEDFLYVRVMMNPVANVNNIATDTSYHGGGAIAAYISVDPGPADTTGLTWGWWGSGYDFFVQAYPPDSAYQAATGYPQAVWEHKQSGFGWDFEVADVFRGMWSTWNASNNEVEMAIPKAILFSPRYLQNFVMPESVAIMIYAGENNDPWRADYASNASVKGYSVKLSGVTGVTPEIKLLPTAYGLSQNYPNPFNPSTTISYALPTAGWVTIRVFNLLGQQVSVLINDTQSAGNHVVRFNAADLPSGTYFYRLESGTYHETKKMLLMK
jgi:hypothetical protein